MNLTEIRVAGFGGQGVILAAHIIGKAAAIFQDGYATMTQSFGPEARGSACSAQVIVSGQPVLYPYVTEPDILIAMSQDAYQRFTPELKASGLLLVEQDLVRVAALPKSLRVYSALATRLAEELGKRMVLNVVMVGFFAAVTALLQPEALRRAVADSVPPGLTEVNLRAFEEGYEYGLTQIRPPLETPDLEPAGWMVEGLA
jgi:2-oxoglutarate ferredoxin oxidoreductase subunit gamma